MTAMAITAALMIGRSGASLAPSNAVPVNGPPEPAPEPGHSYPELPETKSLGAWREAAAHCRACDLWKNATQTVFGEGRRTAKVVLVGEQPGDKEDLAGKPFVGPAGRVLDEALLEAGIDRDTVYVTNAVKHFKWRPSGKRRLHEKPNRSEIAACRLWLDAEIGILKPQVVVCLGATAAQALISSSFKVTQQRGKLIPSNLAPHVMATVHPSSILRAPDEAARERERKLFVADLRAAAKVIRGLD
jgi:DNA polymerase